MKKVLGLDLGITSVGYGIVDENYNIIDYGVRLFEERDADKNGKRRLRRSQRRLKSRKRNRIMAMKYLLVKNHLLDSINEELLPNVYELRKRGLHEKLEPKELASALVHLAKRRGSSLEVAIDESDKENMENAASLVRNTKMLQDKNQYICELQLEKLNNGGTIRSHDNIFRTEDYIKEAKQILNNQDLASDLKEKILELIKRRRLYSEGPGSEKFPTPYGSYRLKTDEEGNEVIEHVNLIELMRGKCSIFKDEPRIAKSSYEACLFNLLNDLNNLTIYDSEIGRKITKEEKLSLIEEYVNKKGNLTIPQLCKFLKVDKKQVDGFRKSKSDTPLLTTFDTFAKILKKNLNLSTAQIDNIIEILTKTQIVEERCSEIHKLDYDLTEEVVFDLANLTKVNGYHALSKKAMDILIPQLIDTSKNQMQLIQDLGLNAQVDEKYISKDIPFDDEAIISPVAKRVHHEAIRIVNALRKEYGEFDTIVIETTRAKNSKDERDRIQKRQKKMEDAKAKTDQIIRDLEKNPDKYNNKTKLKLRLYNEQMCNSMYSGDPIDLDLLISDPTAYEIEHIIPYAVSFNNTLNNKCLVSKTENQKKGRRTPWAYFASGDAIGTNNTFEKFKAFVERLDIDPAKKKNLLDQRDLTKFDNMEEFTERNLIDTSYGIRTVMNTMQSFFKVSDINCNVKTIRGAITSTFRGIAELDKSRDEYIHHAVDALIIAGTAFQATFNNIFNAKKVQREDGSLRKTFVLADDPLDDTKFLRFVRNLKNLDVNEYHFSYKVDTKTNRQFSDETIYSTRIVDGEELIVKKYKDIYGSEGESLAKLFKDGNENDLLMAKNDEATFKLFKDIYQAYQHEKNPFLKYKEENGFIRKYSKKGNGPIITSVKYYASKLGNHVDISNNYNLENSKKRVVLTQISPYRTDIYQSVDGTYKMLTVRRNHIRQIAGKNVINKDEYNKLLRMKNILDSDKFLFSLYRNSILGIKNKKDSEIQLYCFIGTNNDISNKIEVKLICAHSDKRCKPTIGKNIEILEKYDVSLLGKYQKVKQERLKLEW